MTKEREIQYEFVNSQVQYHNQKVMDAYASFIRIFALIVGGAIWLRLQEGFEAGNIRTYALLADILVIFLTVVTVVTIWENVRAWYGYRHAQVKLGGVDADGEPNVPSPRQWYTYLLEIAMILAMVIAMTLFCVFNPFTL